MATSPPLPSASSDYLPQNPDSLTRRSVDRNESAHLNIPSRPSLAPGRQSAQSPYHGGFWDPRSSSTQSLCPIESAGSERRRLLLIYLHGFLGDETTFKSFPAHLHNILTASLVETHVVHTKIYPRYKSRNHISFARDDFSSWLAPHENNDTDVILVGHSLGGILAAEVCLTPSNFPQSETFFRHRILGIVAIDTPFLGMHPGVVKTGIASLFRSSPEVRPNALSSPPESVTQPSSGTPSFSGTEYSSPEPVDPNYNPSYVNDVKLANRTGKRQRAWYFWNKHSNNLFDATQSYLTSHLEFGGCLADYPGLRKRYDAIRSLDDINELAAPRWQSGKMITRVRFVNYYSASTGVTKERKPGVDEKNDFLQPPRTEPKATRPSIQSPASDVCDTGRSLSLTPRLSVEEYEDGQMVPRDLEDEAETFPSTVDQDIATTTEQPVVDKSLSGHVTYPAPRLSNGELDDLPPIADLLEAPQPLDPTQYNNKDALKVAQKDYERQMKAYERAKKDRQKSINDREKILQKRRKIVAKEEKKAQKVSKREQEKLRTNSSEGLTLSGPANPESATAGINNVTEQKSQGQDIHKVKVRKFCALPPADKQTGARDPLWVRVDMKGMDEVVAHMAMFNEGITYATMVGDIAHRIEEWIQEDVTVRALHDETTA